MSSLDALLGRILNRGTPLELQGGVDFKAPLSATANESAKTIEIEVDLSDIESSIEDLETLIGDLEVVTVASMFGASVTDLTASAGTTTLTADTYYRNVTLTGTASIVTAGFRLYVCNELNLENAQAGAINGDGADNTGINAATGLAAGTLGGSGDSGAGGGGGAGNNNGSAGAQAATCDPSNGGSGGAGGAGGNGGGGKTGGAGGAARSPSNYSPVQVPVRDFLRGVSLIKGGCGGSGGGGGGGSVSGSGANAGGSGTGGRPVQVWARKLRRGSSTAVGAIRSRGGRQTSASPGGGPGTDCGGAGGAGGAGGGPVHLIVGELLGSAATNMVTAPGSNGANGQSGNGTGTAGTGGASGGGGEILFVDLGAGTVTYLAPSAPVAASGATGGTAATQGVTV